MREVAEFQATIKTHAVDKSGVIGASVSEVVEGINYQEMSTGEHVVVADSARYCDAYYVEKLNSETYLIAPLFAKKLENKKVYSETELVALENQEDKELENYLDSYCTFIKLPTKHGGSLRELKEVDVEGKAVFVERELIEKSIKSGLLGSNFALKAFLTNTFGVTFLPETSIHDGAYIHGKLKQGETETTFQDILEGGEWQYV